MKKSEKKYDIEYPSKIAEVLFTAHKFDFYDFDDGHSDFYIIGMSKEEKSKGLRKREGVRNTLVKENASPSIEEELENKIEATRIIDDKTLLLSIIELGDRLLESGLLFSSALLYKMHRAFSYITKYDKSEVYDPGVNVKDYYYDQLSKAGLQLGKKHLDMKYDSFALNYNNKINEDESYLNFANEYYHSVFMVIEEWVHEYGLPFYEDGQKKLSDPGSVYSMSGRYVCNLRIFIDWLTCLHSNFYLWRYAQFDEKPKWLKEKSGSLERFAFYLKKDHVGGDIQYQLVYRKNTDTLDFLWASDNLLAVAELQIALLASSKDPDGKSIKRCHKCGVWFEASNSNEVYCKKRPGCNAKAVNMATYRKRIKSKQ